MKSLVLFTAVFLALMVPLPALAQAPTERGLLITPPRQYLEADPGKSTKSSITVANLTENEVTVALSVQQFSVADYTYDYRFEPPKEHWVTLETSQISLKKTESRAIAYTVHIPETTTPGGHYFTVFASMTPKEGKVVQAATVVYVAISGELVKTSQTEENALPFVSFGGDIPYKLNIRNTGNTHFFTYLSGKLSGLSARPPQTEIAHLLMPQTVRAVEGTISPPLLPGIYSAEYGFKEEDGHETIFRQYILHMPIWSLVLLVGLIWFALAWWKWRRTASRSTGS